MHVLAHALWQQRCLEVASRLHHVGVVDQTRRTYRHHGWQRDAPRRIASSATRRCASHHIATQRLSRWGSPAARAFSADGPPQAPVAPRRSCNCCQTTGLNRRAVGAYSRDVRVARKGNPGFGWVVDVLWPDGETEVVKGFVTGRRVDRQTFRGLAGKTK